MNYDGLLAADANIRSDPDGAHTVSLLVAQHGETVFKRCYRNSGVADLHCAHPVTKSFISSPVGILAGEGLLSADDPVSSLLDAPVFRSDAAKTAVAVGHLLTTSSGLYEHGWWDIAKIDGNEAAQLDSRAVTLGAAAAATYALASLPNLDRLSPPPVSTANSLPGARR